MSNSMPLNVSRLLVFLIGLSCVGLACAQAQDAEAEGEVAEEAPTDTAVPSEPFAERQITHSTQNTDTLRYLLSLPADLDPAGPKQPLLIYLHGAGERGDDISKVIWNGPFKLIEDGQDLGMIVVGPLCPQGSTWNNHLPTLLALIDQIEVNHPVDPDRIYVTGISMGGYGTAALAARQPERFAAAVPICGGLGSIFEGWALSSMPIWAFHGDIDDVVPKEESQRLVDMANRRGGENARLTLYEGVGHGSWVPAYQDPELWQWLKAQSRAAEE